MANRLSVRPSALSRRSLLGLLGAAGGTLALGAVAPIRMHIDGFENERSLIADKSALSSPGAVGGICKRRDFGGRGVHAADSRAGLVHAQECVASVRRPVACPGHRIFWDPAEVLSLDKIVQRCRRGFLVDCIVLDRFVHFGKILGKRSLVCSNHGKVVPTRADRRENQDDSDDYHQFEQGESAVCGPSADS